MSALFEEQNDVVVEYMGEAILPIKVFDGMTLYHESFDIQKVEVLFSTFGGSVHGHTIRHNNGAGIDSSQFAKEQEENV